MKGQLKERRGQGQPGGMWRRVGSFMAGFFLFVLLVSETIVVVAYAVPALAASLFSELGIAVDRTLPVADFAMGDLLVLTMLWGSSTLVMCILAAMVQWQIMKAGWRLVTRFLKAAVGRDGGPSGKGDDGE